MRRKANARRKTLRGSARRHADRGGLVAARRPLLPAGDVDDLADGPEPIAKEFQRVETEIRLGRPADEALQAMAERLGLEELRVRRAGVNIQRQVGGSLADILDMVADTVREREQFRRKVRALTAMGRASAYVAGRACRSSWPLLIFAHRAGATCARLWSTSTGHLMLVIGLFSMTIGGL